MRPRPRRPENGDAAPARESAARFTTTAEKERRPRPSVLGSAWQSQHSSAALLIYLVDVILLEGVKCCLVEGAT